MNIFYMLILVSALPLYSMQMADQPPPYCTNPFLEALDSENVDTMLSQAEAFFNTDYLQAWGLTSAATAYETNGQASYTIAQRLFAPAGDPLHRPEIMPSGGRADALGRYYLRHACVQKNIPAQKLFEQLNYEKFKPSSIYEDPTLATFKEFIRSRRKLTVSDFLKHADCLNHLPVGHHYDLKHSLRALAFAVIGLNQHPQSTELAVWLGKFISHIGARDFGSPFLL